MPENGLANFCCGQRVSQSQQCKILVDTRGYNHAAICRSNQCGRYLPESDTCGVLTDRGKRGAIQWLYSHPDANCPNDPPMWTNEDDTVGAGKDKQERLGDALERTIEDRPTK
jgi:hypothetical protein